MLEIISFNMFVYMPISFLDFVEFTVRKDVKTFGFLRQISRKIKAIRAVL